MPTTAAEGGTQCITAGGAHASERNLRTPLTLHFFVAESGEQQLYDESSPLSATSFITL